MSLTEYPNVEQNSPEWHNLRRGMLTASTIGQLITPATLRVASNDKSRALTWQLVAERIAGWTDPTYQSDDMWRGSMDEPLVRDLYAEHHAPVTEMGFMVREVDNWKLGYSPDGLVGNDGLIEVKSRRPKKHVQTVLSDEPPSENVAQIQAGLFVSGRQWCDYVSFCSGMHLWVTRVYPDPEWQEAIKQAAEAFEESAQRMQADYERAVEGLPMTERHEYDRVELKL